MFLGQGKNGVHVGDETVEMHHHDDARRVRDQGFDRLGRHDARVGIDIGPAQRGAGPGERHPCGTKRMRRQDHFLAWFEIGQYGGQLQR